MPVIHGASHQALSYFRTNPAALAVYWCYLARVNYENVAWPSLKRLANDTGWSYNSCRNARDWLEEHGAIERVYSYVRPQWRELPSAELAQKINFDQSQYYRPTGALTIDGQQYPLLYFPNQEMPHRSHHDPSDRISQDAPIDHPVINARNDHELSAIFKLDSTLYLTPAANAAQALDAAASAAASSQEAEVKTPEVLDTDDLEPLNFLTAQSSPTNLDNAGISWDNVDPGDYTIKELTALLDKHPATIEQLKILLINERENQNRSGMIKLLTPKMPRSLLIEYIKALASAFGHNYDVIRASEVEFGRLSGVAKDLWLAGVDQGEINDLYRFCKGQGWPSFTANALPGWVAAWRASQKPKRNGAGAMADDFNAKLENLAIGT